jgi:5-methylcytosine-specific restriction endonuclease McrA
MTATEDVGTTQRKPLTPTQRLKLFEVHGGRCYRCGTKILGMFIDEHIRPLALGGSNDLDNRAPVHPKCAEDKTRNEDMPRIVKAKAQKRAAHGIKADRGPPIPGSKRSGWKRKMDGTLVRR